jgi:signal transduction histidine kinase
MARGIGELRLRPTDVGALVRQVVEQSEATGERFIHVDAESVVASVEPAKVERIVENLISNAVRHTSPETLIWVAVRCEQDGVLIAVDDNGLGIPEELRETIFEPFRQGANVAAHAPGVGIGLSLVARFAELHNGRAWVEASPEGGASFRVWLPMGSAVTPATGYSHSMVTGGLELPR